MAASNLDPQDSPPVEATSLEMVTKYKEILVANGINDPVSEVIVKGSGLTNENMGSVTEYVTVKFEDEGKADLLLFTKRLPNSSNNSFAAMLEDLQLFHKESEFFMKYLPIAKEYCESRGHAELLDIYPKCYYGDDKLIVLENVVLGKGFIMLKKEDRLDLAATRLALINLAKHHAISYAVIQSNGGPSEFLKTLPKLQFEGDDATAKANLEPSVLSGIGINIKILERIGCEGGTEACDFYRAKRATAWNELNNCPKDPSYKIRAIIHGDYWSNNMLWLKDEETNQVTTQIAVDFQGVRYTSPGIDLGYMLFTSVKPEIRRKHLSELLQLYLDQLKATADVLGQPISLTFEELQADFIKSFKFGYWLSAMVGEVVYAVMSLETIDLTGEVDLNEAVENFDKSMKKWVDDNPGKCEEYGKDLIEQVKEYERLCSGNLL